MEGDARASDDIEASMYHFSFTHSVLSCHIQPSTKKITRSAKQINQVKIKKILKKKQEKTGVLHFVSAYHNRCFIYVYFYTLDFKYAGGKQLKVSCKGTLKSSLPCFIVF